MNSQPEPGVIDLLFAEAEALLSYEMLTGPELAGRLKVKPTWIRKQTASSDPLPHVKLGRYVRFLWGSPDLDKWLSRRYRT
jgi:hypothetical protein